MAAAAVDSILGHVCWGPPALLERVQGSSNVEERREQNDIVAGRCNFGHDIAQEFYEQGYDVTVVQR